MRRRALIIVRLGAYLPRRRVAARRMWARGYAPRDIARLLGLSPDRVTEALSNTAPNGRVWNERERAAFAREMERTA